MCTLAFGLTDSPDNNVLYGRDNNYLWISPDCDMRLECQCYFYTFIVPYI